MFLDIGVGALVTVLVSYFFQWEPSWNLLAFSVFFALLPDADFVYFYFKPHNPKYDHEHRDYIHYPLLYLPLGTGVIFLLLGNGWAVTFFLVSLAHFIHDSIGIGWGIKWLFPFSRNNYSFFYLAGAIGKEGRRHWVFTFSEKELPLIAKKYGDPDWLKNIYFKWSRYAQIEFAVFLIALLVLFFYFK